MGGDAAPSSASPQGPIPKFPREWTVFSRNFEATFRYTMDLGTERDHPLFAVRLHSGFAFFGRPALVLHAGATKDGPRVGLVKDATLNPARPHDFDVYVPGAGAGGSLDEDDASPKNVKVEVRARLLEVFPVHALSVEVGGMKEERRVEAFEWRHVFGGDVSDLVGGTAAGWTLVRVATGEVVAVWAEGYKNKKESMRFRFLNTGVSGELGSVFESAAVVSALGMWDHARREQSKNKSGHGEAVIQL